MPGSFRLLQRSRPAHQPQVQAIQSSVPGSAICGKNMLAMYRGQSQETAPSLFSADGAEDPAEALPRTGKPPKEAAFRRRFGLALLASVALHVLLLVFAPGISPATLTTQKLDQKLLTVSLNVPAAAPGRPEANDYRAPSTGQPEPLPKPEPLQPPAPQEPEQTATQVEPEPVPIPDVVQQQAPVPGQTEPILSSSQAEPISSVTPTEPIRSATSTEPVPANLDNHTSSEEQSKTDQTSQDGIRASDSQKALEAAETYAPKPPEPDATQIAQEFKLAFLKLLAYPEAARRRGVQGTVGLRIIMNTDGRITEAQVSQTSGSSILDKAAVAAALATPGPLKGPGRRLELTIRVSFEAGKVLARP
jgi:periplasmic protein TonB